MRPQPSQVFRTNAASRLDDVELIAALLERDATNGRASFAERGTLVLPRRRRHSPSILRRLHVRCAAGAARAARIAAAIGRLVMHRRLLAAVRATGNFAIDLMIVLSTAGLAIVVLTAVYLLAVPPV